MNDLLGIAKPLIDEAPMLISEGQQYRVGYTIEFTVSKKHYFFWEPDMQSIISDIRIRWRFGSYRINDWAEEKSFKDAGS